MWNNQNDSINIYHLIHRLLYYISNICKMSDKRPYFSVDMNKAMVLWDLVFLVGQADYFCFYIENENVWIFLDILWNVFTKLYFFVLGRIQNNLRLFSPKLLLFILLMLLILIFVILLRLFLIYCIESMENHPIFLLKIRFFGFELKFNFKLQLTLPRFYAALTKFFLNLMQFHQAFIMFLRALAYFFRAPTQFLQEFI